MGPSRVFHHVEPQTANKERITLAFNVNRGETNFEYGAASAFN